MNKFAFVFLAAPVLALAACNGAEEAETNAAAAASEVTNEAIADVNSAEAATNSALDANADVMANETGDVAAENGADAANAAGNTAEAN